MRLAISFALNCSKKIFVEWMGEFSEKVRGSEIRQQDGSAIRLQPMRLRVARGGDSGNRLDCLFEGIYEPVELDEEPYMLGAVFEFQVVSSGVEMCFVTAISQHRGVSSYFVDLSQVVANRYPEAKERIGEQLREYGVTSGSKRGSAGPRRRGRPRNPEYDCAWVELQGGMDLEETYLNYIHRASASNTVRMRRRFRQAMRYRAKASLV